MKSVINKARKPLRIPLPGGKTLFLSLNGRGQVPDDALTRPAFKKLVKAGDIEVLDDQSQRASGEKNPSLIHESTRGHAGVKSVTKRGDR